MRATLFAPPGEQEESNSVFNPLLSPKNQESFEKLAENLRMLPGHLSNPLLPITTLFRVKKCETALKKVSAMLVSVRQLAAEQLTIEGAREVSNTCFRIECQVKGAVEVSARLLNDNLQETALGFHLNALTELFDSFSAEVLKIDDISRTLRSQRTPTATIGEVMKRIQSTGSSKIDASLTVLGEDTESLERPKFSHIEKVAPSVCSDEIQQVAGVVSAHKYLELSSILLTTSNQFVGKDGEIYQIRVPGRPFDCNGLQHGAKNLVLSYNHVNGFAHVGSIAHHTISGVEGPPNATTRVTKYALEGADIEVSSTSDAPIHLVYSTDGTVEEIDGSTKSEIAALSGACTALPAFLAQMIDRTTCLPLEERVQVLCSAFFEREYVYSKDAELRALVEQLPRALRLSFLAGLRIGSCETISYELQNFLALAGIPAIVEGGVVFDPEKHAFCTPGHARVKCLTDHPLVIDATLWTSTKYSVSRLSEELSKNILSDLIGKGPQEAYRIGEQLRSELVYKSDRNGTEDSVGKEQTDRGHNLKDDFQKRSLITYQWDIQEEAAQLSLWSELIQQEVKYQGEDFFSKFFLSDELKAFLEQANNSVIEGRGTLFTDWLLAYARHPDKAISACVTFPLFCSFDPFEAGKDVKNIFAALLFLADNIDFHIHSSEGSGPLNGNYVRQFMLHLSQSEEVRYKTSEVEGLFVRVAIKTLNQWVGELQQTNEDRDEELFASYAASLIGLSRQYSPAAAAILQEAVANGLHQAGGGVIPAFLSGLRGSLNLESNASEKVNLFLNDNHSPFLFRRGEYSSFVTKHFSALITTPDLSVALFERSRAFLEHSFRRIACEAVDTHLAELAKAEIGNSDYNFCSQCRGNESHVANIRPNDYRNFRGFSIYIGDFDDENEFLGFSRSEKFQKALYLASLKALKELLSNLKSLAANIPEDKRIHVAPYSTDLVKEIFEEFSLTLPERSSIYRSLESIFEFLLSSNSCEEFGLLRSIEEKLDSLQELSFIDPQALSSFRRTVHDSEIVSQLCEMLDNERDEFDSPAEGLLTKIAEDPFCELPSGFMPLALLVLRSKIPVLPPALREATEVIFDMKVGEGDIALWQAVMKYRFEEFEMILGELPDSIVQHFFAKVVVTALYGENCTNILNYTFICALEGQGIKPGSQQVTEAMQQAVKHFLPWIKSPEQIQAISRFLCAISGVSSEDGLINHSLEITNPFTNSELQERLSSLNSDSLKPTRTNLWRIATGPSHSVRDRSCTIPPLSPSFWRNSVGRQAGQNGQNTIRSILGTPDPFDVNSREKYVVGDDVKRIDWHASARLDALYVQNNHNVIPTDAKQIAIFVDRSDMGFSRDVGLDLDNTKFIGKLIGFVRSMIADGKKPSLTFFSYGSPDLELDAATVYSEFFKKKGESVRSTLMSDAAQAAASADECHFHEQVARLCPTIAKESLKMVLKKAEGSHVIMLTISLAEGANTGGPSTPIWNDSFSRQLIKSGSAIRVEL